ncbi:18230_t:CDS:2 [Gigaspora margarita]|uniref:18230_t:CDS:1 n=1 Tax=Gigaspora margarita TaxID=4874 RepID=A0ABM8VVP0_GIGMA|nr:18230_t:CDS:2 [Gigaspora margarita]
MSLEDNDDEIKGESNEHLQIPQKTWRKYALKSLDNYLHFDKKSFEKLMREIITNNVEHDYLYNGPNTSKDEYESITKHYSLIEKIINEFKVDVYDYNQFHFNEGESEQIETAYCKSLGKKTILNNLKVDSSVNDATVRQYIGEARMNSVLALWRSLQLTKFKAHC